MKTLTINIPQDRDRLYQIIRYPAGEIQVRLTEEGLRLVAKSNAYKIVANPIPDLMELGQLKSALDGLPTNWYYRQLFLPYMPYGRADRRFVVGDSFALGVFANFINSLAFDRIYTFDVHSNVSLQVMPQLLNLDPIDHYDEVGEVIDDLDRKDLLLIFPDMGAAKRYDPTKISGNVCWTLAEKVRDAATGKLSGFKITEVVKEYKKALIVDDICDGGGTFLGLGEEIRKINPTIRLYLYVSHGIFSQGLDKLDKMFDNIYISEMSFLGEHHKGFKKTGE